jgi:hypothetical protein
MVDHITERGLAAGQGGAITFDIDWAPDFAIDWAADRLIEQGVRATWFVTHSSPAVDRLRNRPDLFELGIHPNLLPGSTHGARMEDVLRHCLELVPEARSMRTHSLVQSSPLLAHVIAETSIETDVSLFIPGHPGLQPVRYHLGGKMLVRIPYFWEDDFEMECPDPDWDLGPRATYGTGIRIFNFHPIHIYLNGASLAPYAAVKQTVRSLQECCEEDLAPHVRSAPGTQTAFVTLVQYLAGAGGGARISDLARSATGRETDRVATAGESPSHGGLDRRLAGELA